MNRPRNRQPRQQHQNSPGQNHKRQPPSKPNGHVPGISEVLPGASVSIVLKADQPTGKETPGIVQDVLTRGNHPRGIKVRTKDGMVGRVQRMIISTEARSSSGERWPTSVPTSPVTDAQPRHWSTRVRGDGNENVPPPRSLADFIPDSLDDASRKRRSPARVAFTSATATCPICGLFEGDEAAVSHHVQSHLD